MKKSAWVLIIAALAIAWPAGAGDSDADTTLKGQFVWNNRNTKGDLEAIFSPTGEGTWNVAFHFEFRGKPHVYEGTAEGSLSEGELKGTVQNENKKRTFTFSGAFEDGKFSGTHAEMEGEREFSTGTLSLEG